MEPALVFRHIHAINPEACHQTLLPPGKTCSGIFVEFICTLANLLFAVEVFQELFKLAFVTPLLKKFGFGS